MNSNMMANFYSLACNALHGIAVAILSVCLSICQMRVLWQNQMMHCRYFDTTGNGSHSNFLTPTLVGGRCPLPCHIFTESDAPPFEKRRLQQISAYNASTVRDSNFVTNIKSTTGFPTSYRWSACITSKSKTGGSKSDFLFFCFGINSLQLDKVCYNVSLCENFHRHSCSTAIPLTNST